MSDDNIQRKMDFIVEQQAKFSVDIELLKESIGLLKESQKTLTADVQALTTDVQALTADVQALTFNVNELRETVGTIQSDMREGFNNLILANEVTRKLTEEVALLAINTSQRVTRLEEKQ